MSTEVDNDWIMPFGRHEGKSIAEVMATDRKYIKWLTSQDWFVNKYAAIYNIINGPVDPMPTIQRKRLLRKPELKFSLSLYTIRGSCVSRATLKTRSLFEVYEFESSACKLYVDLLVAELIKKYQPSENRLTRSTFESAPIL